MLEDLKQTNVHTVEYGDNLYNIYALREYAETLPVEVLPIESLREAVTEERVWDDENQTIF